jgi:RHS repeat-associated protein
VKTVKSIRSDIPSRMWPVYTTGYVFDSFGRMRELTYPDGEVLTYTYDQGGLLETAKGKKGGKSYEYLLDLAYDEYGQRVRLQLGNGVETRYDYDPLTRRLDHIFTTGDGGVLQNIDYSYDNVGNIKRTENQPFITRDATSRSVVQEYGYDDLHRLTSAAGNYAIGSDHLDRYAGTFAYDSIGNFQTKNQRHWYEDPLTGIQSDRPRTTYNFAYQYQGPQPHAVTNVGGNTYSYDDNGNLALRVDDQTGQSRQILWNEENRITSLLDQGKETIFRYDDGGTRIFKRGKYGETIYVDPNFSIREGEVASKHIFAGSTRIATKMVMKENRTGASKNTYVRPTDNKGHSATVPEKSQGNHGQVDKTLDPVLQEQVNGKAWEQRDRKTASANGKGLGKEKRNANGGDAARETLLPGNSEKGLENALANGNGSKTGIYKRLDRLGYEVTIDHRIVLKGTDPTDPDGGTPIFTGPTIPEEQQIYYFHGDHLGSSSVITDRFGRNYEHLEYFPYGETWVEETRSERNLPYKFTGKELDPETGLYYFGARYYDPVVSVWVSVDPVLGEYLPTANREQDSKLPGMGGVFNLRNLGMYSYAGLNPTKYIDPDGRKLEFAPGSTPEFKKKFGEMIQYLNKGKVSAPIAKIQARTETVYVQEGATLNDFYFDPNNDTIVIHPESGLQVSPAKGKSPAKVQTPALGLLHESAHALQHLENPTQQAADVNAPTGDAYGNHEEKRVIQNIETPAAKKLGEPARQGHSGPGMTAVPVKCPTCDN